MKNLTIFICLSMAVVLMNACTGKYYTVEDFQKVRKIDAHVHLDSENPDLAEIAREDNFRLIANTIDFDGIASIEKQNSISRNLRKQFPDNVSYITAFAFETRDSTGWAEAANTRLKADFEDGAIGVKIWKNVGMTFKDSSGRFILVDNPVLDPVINFIISQNKTLLAHIGEPKNCWLPISEMTVGNDRDYYTKNPEYHMYLHPECPSYEQLITARDNFVERHPDLRFVGAHLGSLEWNVDELAKRLDKYPNMAVDLTDRICHLQLQSITDWERIYNFIMKYQDRLIYGTDFTNYETTDPEKAKVGWHQVWLNDWKYFVTDSVMTDTRVAGDFKGLKLPKTVVDKIYFGNAVNWYKLNENER
jgi:predicted TIM-barrel fold metal-dependent hydrolase